MRQRSDIRKTLKLPFLGKVFRVWAEKEGEGFVDRAQNQYFRVWLDIRAKLDNQMRLI